VARDPEDMALDLLGVAVALAPALADLLGRHLDGSSEPLAQRVLQILPDESASARAARELGR
jgi:hypothetical protein